MSADLGRGAANVERVAGTPIVVRRLGGEAPPGGASPRRFFELVYVERGRGQHRIGGRVWSARAGDLFLIGPGVPHDTSQLSVSGTSIRFTREALLPKTRAGDDAPARPDEPLLRPFVLGDVRAGGARLRVPAQRRARWGRRVRALATELERREPGYERAARALLTLLLVDVARLGPDGATTRRHPAPLLSAVFDLIEARYPHPISLRDVALATDRSPGYVTTLVRQATGLTVMQWLMERRMSEARRLLIETDIEIEVVADRVGISDPTWFIRSFKALHGVTPLAWRRLSRG